MVRKKPEITRHPAFNSPKHCFCRIKLMSLNIINKFLSNNIQGDTLPAVVSQAFLNTCAALIQKPCINSPASEVGNQELQTEAVPVRNQQGFPFQILLFFRNKRRGIFYKRDFRSFKNFGSLWRENLSMMISERADRGFNPGFISNAWNMLVQLQNQIWLFMWFHNLFKILCNKRIRRTFEGSDKDRICVPRLCCDLGGF